MGAIHDNARRNPGWQALALGLFYLACFLAAGLGSLFTMVSVGSWYARLAKPSWNPPGWVFGPMWTVLYAMVAVAEWLVWRISRPAGILLVPYLLWVSFAAALNFAFWRLNA